MDIVALGASISAGVKIIKTVATGLTSLNRQMDESEFREKILELREQTSNANQAVLDIRDQVQALQAENQRLEEELKVQSDLTWQDPFMVGITNGNIVRRCCPKCFHSDRKAVDLSAEHGATDLWKCPACTAHYQGPQFRWHNVPGINYPDSY